jgi:hypothetical protein
MIAATNNALAAANDIRDLKPPVAIPNGWEWLWLALSILAGAALLFALWKWWQYRRANAPVVPPIPANVRARHKLGRKRSPSWPSQNRFASWSPTPFAPTSRNDLISARRNAPPRNFCVSCSATDLLSPEQKESLGRFLESCDLVKFAKYEPGENEVAGAAPFRRPKLVEETEPSGSPKPEPKRPKSTGVRK